MEEAEQSRQTVVGAADQMMPITVTHLVVIAVFAAIIVIAILWGMRLRAKRRAAERELEAIGHSRREEPGAAVADPDAPGAAIAAERRAPVEPTDLPAPAPQPVQEPQHAAPATAPAPAEPIASAAPPAPAEPPAAAAPSAPPASPAPAPAPVPANAASDLTTLKGLGPKVAAQLAEMGITSIADLAALSPAEADRIDASLGTFQGRMARDRWVEQARLLAAGDRAGYEAKFGKLG
ncbi:MULTISPECIES: helix-hairpin-helix domain-containing protein [Sphingomonas]|uniref:Helix-hairpin-helix domain-containing protein n=1 Tax=Sphingomonas molluscorum TaxID=418184 RepID=A0ABU8Q3E8_9SPHN|nr:helix-hairpin-helix domain-containing protein [Sphingomonas sp. JUb134]MBM7405793.1 putative flap endonuclease-1-like 5' DNA nuclease [Sphingomonas sp. JUb134]